MQDGWINLHNRGAAMSAQRKGGVGALYVRVVVIKTLGAPPSHST